MNISDLLQFSFSYNPSFYSNRTKSLDGLLHGINHMKSALQTHLAFSHFVATLGANSPEVQKHCRRIVLGITVKLRITVEL